MILSSLSVIYINTPSTKAAGEAALSSTYQVFTISDDQSKAASLGLSLVNGLVIVSVIGLMTFLIVILYKFRCMKFLLGYMILATTVLLGFLGSQMFTVAINKYQLPIDKLSFYLTMYNFAIVGTLAVFYQKGVPTIVNQGYLVANSTIVAWQLSYFNDWMAWALLIMLALYDLFAVLTPCGPLKALVNLMSKEDAPAMPGLLYEAELPVNAVRPGRGRRRKWRHQRYSAKTKSRKKRQNTQQSTTSSNNEDEMTQSDNQEQPVIQMMEEVPKECEDDEKGGNTIKLGLGDFIFYSVLVSKAAENGFAAFVACFLSILTGLGGTLVLLAVYHHALPALPISIFLAVVFFVLTIYCMEPWIQDMWQVPYYF
ncbi:presenilin [Thalassiosira pseudonana CCMP1335]|uniref:Presenilin n=1 Tax=Thalassiosira pseudonana TaxID=35128 RepID=B8C3Y7_THAPS|nr:presenilin [Thalassiosira pseudonana CCMP1335]EED92641.1 presenilin [Thalassiosira pseudonana CCMP1335]